MLNIILDYANVHTDKVGCFMVLGLFASIVDDEYLMYKCLSGLLPKPDSPDIVDVRKRDVITSINKKHPISVLSEIIRFIFFDGKKMEALYPVSDAKLFGNKKKKKKIINHASFIGNLIVD